MADLKVVSKSQRKRLNTQKQGTLRADTIIQVIIDMSGSMSGIARATMEGFNSFIEGQKKEDGRVLVSLTLFDSGWRSLGAEVRGMSNETRIARPYIALPLEEVPELTADVYKPDGGTPLRDAVGSGIEDAMEVLQRVKDGDNPDVLVMIITDGGENTSQKYSAADIKSMVEQREGAGWTFVYMGANQDSWSETQSLGFSQGNVMNYVATDIKEGAFAKIGAAATSYRSTSRTVKAQGLTDTYATSAFFSDAGVTEDSPVE